VPFSADITGSIATADSRWPRIDALCRAAYGEELGEALRAMRPLGHLLGWLDGELVSHACWVERALAPGADRPLRTAYVEAVATAPAYQGRGFASELLRRLVAAVADFALAALAPSDARFYERLGWQRWRGPRAIRRGGALVATPDEEVMIMRLPRTPALDLDAPLSAEWRAGEVW
jgi:GNAT superfamily N-acetyltransferase